MIELLIQGTLMTLKITLAALGIGILGGVGMGILNCQRHRLPFLSQVIHSFVLVIRGTPLFVQVLIFYFGFPQVFRIDLSSFAAGVMALGCNSSSYISEIVRCGIDSIPLGQWEASFALGYTRTQTLWHIILPQMLRNVLPALTNELTAIIKETSILMIIGVSELTKVGRDIVARQLDPMFIYSVVAAIYFFMTTGVSLCTRYFEKRWKR